MKSTVATSGDGGGWAYESNDRSKHKAGGYTPGYGEMDGGEGVSEPYFKVPVPSAPPEGAGADYAGDEHHLSMADWNTLCETGTVTTASGITITIPHGDGKYDPSGGWTVEASVTLDPPALDEGTHSIATGSLVEEHNIDQSTENRGEDCKNNNTAIRPGETVEFEVNNTESIKVVADFLYEAGEQFTGGEQQNGVIHVTPSSGDDSFYGDLTVSIPSGYGQLYHDGQLLEPGNSYPVTLTDRGGNDVSGKLVVTDNGESLSVIFEPDDAEASYAGLELEITLSFDDHSDTDIDISVNGNLVNDKPGQQTEGVTGEGGVLADAVAQMPENIRADVPEHEALVPGGDKGVEMTITARFGDTDDGSESHFFLLEAKPGGNECRLRLARRSCRKNTGTTICPAATNPPAVRAFHRWPFW